MNVIDQGDIEAVPADFFFDQPRGRMARLGDQFPVPVIELDRDEMSIFDVLPAFLPELFKM